MKFYMAPMEGMTGYVFRNVYHKYYGDVDKYFTPFLCSTGLSHKELHDVMPEHNQGMPVVPQILTDRAEDFLKIAERLKEFGYDTVNLNLGCPSGTVVSKGRGAGFLKDTERLERFLDEIFAGCPLKISVKTRIGVQAPKEWEKLQEIYNRFPLEELIVHPRVQKDFYRHPVRREMFRSVLEQSSMPVCYNGDLHSVTDFREFTAAYPDVDCVMMGRGIFKDPGLVGACKNRSVTQEERFSTLRAMLAELLAEYRREMGSDTHTLYKMKEVWTYLGQSIPGGERLLKEITKVRSISEYKVAAREALRRWEENCCMDN